MNIPAWLIAISQWCNGAFVSAQDVRECKVAVLKCMITAKPEVQGACFVNALEVK